jgi:hypothetical protein
MVGKKVQHRVTLEIKTIAEYSISGSVKFTDGTSGDIHIALDPTLQSSKCWVYYNDDQPQPINNYKIF